MNWLSLKNSQLEFETAGENFTDQFEGIRRIYLKLTKERRTEAANM